MRNEQLMRFLIIKVKYIILYNFLMNIHLPGIIISATLALLFPALSFAADTKDLLMGAVVKSDNWKVNRKDNTETFKGHLSFKNDLYEIRAGKGTYYHNDRRWIMQDSVYSKRKLENNASLELWCDIGQFYDKKEKAVLWKKKSPVKMRYTGKDGIINGKSDKITADNKAGEMKFSGKFNLATENIQLFSSQGTYMRESDAFFLKDTVPATEGMPMTTGIREGYNFAIRAENIEFYKETRDVKLKNRVTGWVKDIPYVEDIAAKGSKK